MRVIARLAAGLLAGIVSSALCPVPARSEVEVTYVANAGFLLASGEERVLIDALFDDGIAGYRRIPVALRPFLEGAVGPFEGVDLVLATHHHGDHFGPRAVIRHLRANPWAQFVSTPQAAGRLRLLLRDERELLPLVQELLPEEGTRQRFSHRGISVTVLNLHHGRGRSPAVQNLGFLIDLGGFKILHIGDTEAEADVFAPLALATEEIDLALLPAWYLTVDGWVEMTRKFIRPRHVVAMHIANPDAPASYFGEDGSHEGRLATIRKNFPNVVILERPGDSHQFQPAAPAAPEPATQD